MIIKDSGGGEEDTLYKELLVIKYYPGQFYSNECISHGRPQELELLKLAYDGEYIIPNHYPKCPSSLVKLFFQVNPYVPVSLRFMLSEKGEKYVFKNSPLNHIWHEYKVELIKEGYAIG